jgi:phosphoserine phosphatase
MTRSYPRLIFFDLEGTLLQKAIHLDNGKVAPSAWTLLAERLGPAALAEEEATKDRWLAGGYPNYVEWMRDTIKIHQRYGLTMDVFEDVMNSVQHVEGVEAAIESFRRRGCVTAIISGGFKSLADRTQRRLLIDHSIAGCEYFFNRRSGLLEHWNLLPADYAGKVGFMKLLMTEYGWGADDCAFVGDGPNDVQLAQAVGLSIAFNAHDALSSVCSHKITQLPGAEDFRAVALKIEDVCGSSD